MAAMWAVVSSGSHSSRSLQRRDRDANHREQARCRRLPNLDVPLPTHDAEPQLLQSPRFVNGVWQLASRLLLRELVSYVIAVAAFLPLTLQTKPVLDLATQEGRKTDLT